MRPRRVLVNLPPQRTRHVIETVRGFEPFVTVLFLNRWMRFTGSDADLVLKAPMVVFGVLAIVAGALATAEVAGTWAALAAAVLLALSPFHVYYAQEVNNYAIAVFATACSYLCYFRLLRRGRLLDGAGYVVSMTLALLTHYYTLIVFASHALGLLVWHGPHVGRLGVAALPLGAVAAAFGFYLPILSDQLAYMFSMQSGAFGGSSYLWERLIANSLFPWLGDLASRVPPFPLGLAGAVAAWLLFTAGLASVRGTRLRSVVAVNALAPLAIIVAAYLFRHSNQVLWPRYGLFFTFGLFFGAAAFWADGFRRPGRILVAVVVLGVLATGLHFQFRGNYQRNWAEAAAIIERDGRPEDPVVVHLAILTHPLARYLETNNRLFGLDVGSTLPLQVEAAVDGEAAVWMLFAWHDGSPGPAVIRRVLECRYPYRDDYQLFGIELSRYHAGPTRAGTHPTACGPPNGFVTDSGGCAGHDAVTVRGWADLPGNGARLHLWAHDRDFGPVTPLAGARANAWEAPPGSRTSFEKRIDLSAVPEGSLLRVTLRMHAPEAGTDTVARESLPCIRRPSIVEHGVPGPHLMHGTLGAPRPRKRFVRGEPFHTSGWVFSTRGIAAILYHVDGRLTQRSRQHGFALPDVAAAFPNVPADIATYSGFVTRIDTTGLAPGPHVLTAVCLHPDGSQTALPDARRFDVVEGG